MTIADIIQVAILIALVWYAYETKNLRKWQKKQVQISVLNTDMQRVRNLKELHGNSTPYGEPIDKIVRRIYELGEFDARVLYADKSPLKKRKKFFRKSK